MNNVQIDYTNWRGQRDVRVIRPVKCFYGSNEYHKNPQWLLAAYDIHKDEDRTFALASVHNWDGPIDVIEEALRSPFAAAMEAVGKVTIEVEQQLCRLLGRTWVASTDGETDISIDSLGADLERRLQAPPDYTKMTDQQLRQQLEQIQVLLRRRAQDDSATA